MSDTDFQFIMKKKVDKKGYIEYQGSTIKRYYKGVKYLYI